MEWRSGDVGSQCRGAEGMQLNNEVCSSDASVASCTTQSEMRDDLSRRTSYHRWDVCKKPNGLLTRGVVLSIVAGHK